MSEDAGITQCSFEGANIIIYTKNKDFFLNPGMKIKDIVNLIKKRIELRSDPCITMDEQKTEQKIQEILPEEAKVSKIIFDAQRSQAIIEAEKPGIIIGKSGEYLKKIKAETLWVPLIRRTPSIRSKITENIRQVLYENNDWRKKFLDRVGKRIYSGWIRGKKEGWLRLSFLGGSRQVGRSCYLLQTAESRILVDCGINVAASDEDMFPILDAPELKINEIDAIVISHAHLDHSAMIPLLFKYGYDGPVYCTEPTRDIMALLALDYIGVTAGEGRKQLFSSNDVKEMVKHTICLDYKEVSDITPDIRLTFYNAGHILGSSMCHFHVGNGLHNYLYTGDMNYEKSNLLAPASTKFPRLETVMVESTYGAKTDTPPSREQCEELLINIIKGTIERGGKILMPVLGVGRSQEIQLIIEKVMREGKIKEVPVFVQGLVWDVTAIHTAYPDFFNSKIKRAIFYDNNNPFLSPIFKQVGSRKEMEKVIEREEPCIILATSGMMTGGASVEYFKNLAENPKNSLVITNYCGIGSLARRLQDGETEISFMAGENKTEITKVNMDIHTIKGFSGHSSRAQLLNFIYKLNPKPKRVICVHGENRKVLDLASSIHKLNKIETNAPRNLDSLRLR